MVSGVVPRELRRYSMHGIVPTVESTELVRSGSLRSVPPRRLARMALEIASMDPSSVTGTFVRRARYANRR
jgi:hypothetical protein